jgi:glycosyltransferase involved in cell wall biosynthesis
MSRINETEPFESVSAIVPFLNEKASVRVLIDSLLGDPRAAVREVLVVYGTRTTEDSLRELERLATLNEGRVLLLRQHLPFLGGALREGIARARGSHCLFIYSDLESDPALVPELVTCARRQPEAVVSASRWLAGGRFEGYGRTKRLLNLAFQKLIGLVFFTRVTDLTFGYRLYPRRLLQAVQWRETGHPFVLESVLVPLVLKVPVVEVPTVWRARREGQSSWNPLNYYKYLLTAARIRAGLFEACNTRSVPGDDADGQPVREPGTGHRAS